MPGCAGFCATPPSRPRLLRRLVDEHFEEIEALLEHRREWTAEQFEELATHPDPEVRKRQVQHAVARSAHIGLRRGLARNQHLDPTLIPVLSADAHHAVRLLLCESQRDVPFDLVLATYLEAKVLNRVRPLDHPAFDRDGLAQRLADHPDPHARALARLDPDPPADIIDRLIRDEIPEVRGSVP